MQAVFLPVVHFANEGTIQRFRFSDLCLIKRPADCVEKWSLTRARFVTSMNWLATHSPSSQYRAGAQMNSIAIDRSDRVASDLFGYDHANLLRFDRDTTCGSGIEVEYVGSNGKLLYHRDADRMFSTNDTTAALAALTAASNAHYKGTGIHPIFVADDSANLARELKLLTRRIARAARRLLQLRLD